MNWNQNQRFVPRMMVRDVVGFLLCVGLLAVSGCQTRTSSFPVGSNEAREGQRSQSTGARPNIVLIFTDDLGYGDIGSFGATGYETPHLDRLAGEGTRFTSFYVAQAVCSASRAALLTGCYPNRIGLHGALGPGSAIGINPDETTLAELLQQQGYQTGIFGKWHLGDAPEFLPTRHGFDRFVGIPYSNDMWPFHPTARPGAYPDLPYYDQETVTELNPDQTQLTTRLTEAAVRFIDEHTEAPFFLYLAHPMPHVPLFVSSKFAGTTPRGLFGDVVSEIDWSVGQVMDALRRNGLEENTWVIFTSDNGPWLNYGDHAGSAGPFREGKGTAFEGGVRMPCIMRWPGRIPSGATQTEPLMTIDVLPTVAQVLGAPLPALPLDGKDVWPLIAGLPDAKSPHEAYLFYYAQNELQAIRSGPWKYHFEHTARFMDDRAGGQGGIPVDYENRKTGPALYHLEQDPGERMDVASQHPEVVARFLELAEEARAELGDRLTGKLEGTGTRPPGRRTQPAG